MSVKKRFFNILLCACAMCVWVVIFFYRDGKIRNKYSIRFDYEKDFVGYENHDDVVNGYYEKRLAWTTSNLGSILFKNASRETFLRDEMKNKTYNIMIWKHWDWLKQRHIQRFSKLTFEPLEGCSVQNCRFTGEPDFEKADAVVVHLQKGLIPTVKNRKTNQRWIFLSDEAPTHTFSLAKKKPTFSSMANVFNWSMTYRTDSDIPVPYGRTVALYSPLYKTLTFEKLTELIPNWKKKRRDVITAVLMSNCGVKFRMVFLKELKKYINVDIQGKCSNKNSCPGHFKADCETMSNYLFYLVLENSKCNEYLTEKGFFHAYAKGSIPIILGPTEEDCEKLLPPNSYLHVKSFKSIESLAREMISIAEDERKLLSFHVWRNDFEVVNEHGFFGSKSQHYCRVCEAMNYNDPEVKVYNEYKLKSFLDPKVACTS